MARIVLTMFVLLWLSTTVFGESYTFTTTAEQEVYIKKEARRLSISTAKLLTEKLNILVARLVEEAKQREVVTLEKALNQADADTKAKVLLLLQLSQP